MGIFDRKPSQQTPGNPAFGQPQQKPNAYRSAFEGIDKEKIFDKGVYFDVGSYVVVVNSTKIGQSRKRADFYVVNTTVIESTRADTPVGSERDWMQISTAEGWLGRLKGFLVEATGVPEEEIDEAGTLESAGDEQPLANLIMRVQATPDKKKNGESITAVRLYALRPDEIEKYAEIAKQVLPGFSVNPLQG